MSMHHVECAAVITDMVPSQKLAFMAVCDAADKDTGLGFPGFDTIQAWSGLGRSRVHENLSELIAAGYLERVSPGRKGKRAVFRVFAQIACCVMHDPMGTVRDHSGQPDPNDQPAPKPASPADRTLAEPQGPAKGPVVGPAKGPVQAGPLPSTPVPQQPAAARGRRIQPDDLPPGVQQLRAAFAQRPSIKDLGFAGFTQAEAIELDGLVWRHGAEKLADVAVANHLTTKSARGFLDTWRGILDVKTLREAPRGPECPECHTPVTFCDATAANAAPGEACRGYEDRVERRAS